MATKRDGVFVWVTWLARVMAGEQNCEWASWFKAHYENYDKAPSDFDTAKWNIEHTLQLRRLQLERRKLGERVFLEGENALRLTLPSGVTIAGKPDLITLPDGQPTTLGVGQPTIRDVKTGRARCSDRVQVMLYMHLLPQARPEYAGTRPAGCIVYNDSRVDIPPEAVDQKFIGAVEYFLGVIAGLEPALKVPSRHECRFCDIARTECPEKIEG
jgi:PD-(D/E)XK nuclease superfamily